MGVKTNMNWVCTSQELLLSSPPDCYTSLCVSGVFSGLFMGEGRQHFREFAVPLYAETTWLLLLFFFFPFFAVYAGISAKLRSKKEKKRRGTSVKWGKGALVYLSLEGEKAVSPEKKKKKKNLWVTWRQLFWKVPLHYLYIPNWIWCYNCLL